MAYESDASVGTLIRGALDDVRELVREELALARVEMRREMSKLSSAGIQLGIAAVALWFAGMFVLVALALGVSWLLGWPAWSGFVLVALVLAVAGGVTLASARSAMKRVEPLPRTVATSRRTSNEHDRDG